MSQTGYTALFRETILGLVTRGMTHNSFAKYDDEVNPQKYMSRYSKDGTKYQEMQRKHKEYQQKHKEAEQEHSARKTAEEADDVELGNMRREFQEHPDETRPNSPDHSPRQHDSQQNDSDSNSSQQEDQEDKTKHGPNAPPKHKVEKARKHMKNLERPYYFVGDNAFYQRKKELEQQKQESDPNLVSWESEDDLMNPQNWSSWKKSFVTFEICLLTFSVYIGSSIYSAGTQDIMMTWGLNTQQAVLGLTLFVAGYAIGPMIWAPLSEIPQIGRNPIYIATLIVFVALQAPTALAQSRLVLWPLRFFAGFFGSPALATGGATITDMYSPQKRAYTIGIWGCAAVCGPVLGPLLGGFAANVEGWRWTIWILLWLSGGTLLFLIPFFPETSADNILHRKAVRLREITGNKDLYTSGEKKSESMTPAAVAKMTLVKPFVLCFVEPIVFALNAYIGLVYALLYIWFESFPLVFTQLHGFTLGEEGLAFMGILVGTLIAMASYSLYLYYYLESKFDEEGNLQPIELRLHAAMVGSFCIPICLFWFGWSAYRDVHWIVPIIGSGFFGLGTFLLFQSVLNYLPDAYQTNAASVLAGNDFIRSIFGAGFPIFADIMYRALGIGWASSVLGFIAVCMIPIPFVLYKYGAKIREKSKYADA